MEFEFHFVAIMDITKAHQNDLLTYLQSVFDDEMSSCSLSIVISRW
jgi:hypothetical protein